ncbi:Equilibrative nucleoside transporter 1 [Hondaea fermentalgiana]|uniref:Equilibrative nucleoside transporter 1 n=1 Tax=Hondaea fermentalgiana TaxID=2315210 RepID=A0A2R5GCW0_9STRA|nr:Equilibrative nucleoside transporter 1 [Hondaea fermentalgiana]|eukprot:GBG28812.1 Equilibrative nucleoside transporter 1 [Hondaea fermentalgiana]
MDEALFFTMGVGSLFPWNAFITESSYFSRRFQGTSYVSTFESGFGVAYNLSNVLSLLLLLLVQKYMTERMLIVAPFVGTGIVFCATALLTLVDISVDALFYATTATVLLAGIMAAPMISGVAGLAARFRKSCASAFFSGQAFGGVVASVSSLVTSGVAPQPSDFCNATALFESEANLSLAARLSAKHPFVVDWSAFSYFTIAAAVCFISVAAYMAVKSRQGQNIVPTFGVGLGGTGNGSTEEDVDDDEEEDEDGYALLQPDIQMEAGDDDDDEVVMLEVVSGSQELNSALLDSNILLTFLVTLSLFPALTAQTYSRRECAPGSSRFWNDLFVPSLFLCFNGADLLGRLLQGRWQPFSGRGLMFLALSRCIFWPLFFFQHIRGSRLDPVLGSDLFPIATSLACGFTNGFVGTASMVNAQLSVPMVHRDLASTIATICLTIGLTIGSTSSYLSVYIVQG